MPGHPGLLIAAVVLTTPLSSTAGTTTTTYTYNADGALTAMTVQAGDDAATATYVTWDNFVPDAAAPATGTLSVGNGRLAAIGAAPGGRPGYGFDVRDRLTTAPAADAAAVSYAYHAGGLLAEATSVFYARVGASASLSLASAIATGADRGFKHFSWSDFRNSLEGGRGKIFDNNIVGGRGYNPFNLTGKELADGMALLRDQPKGQAFIFRRATPQHGLFDDDIPVHTSRLEEWLHIGSYHEQLVAVSADGLYLTELADEGTRMVHLEADPHALRPMLEQLNHGQFELVGRTDRFVPETNEIEKLGARVSREQSDVRWHSPRTWRGLGNASQRHAALVLMSLGMR